MEPIKFIHTADLHLDSPFKGLRHLPSSIFEKLKQSTFQAFQKIIELAFAEQVDFVLIAGDIFDEDVRSLKAQIALRTEFERLEKAGIHVFIIHGNHDHLNGRWAKLNWPETVHFFSKDVEMIPFLRNDTPAAHIYGFSYGQRAITRNMTEYYQKVDGTGFHIGMLHGNLEGKNGHDPYAPFKVEQLLEKNFDYWALGHIHKQQVIYENPCIIYPGNIQGRHSKETGQKGCYLVELTSNETNYQFIQTATIIWETEQVSIDELSATDELILKIQKLKDTYRNSNDGTILAIELIGNNALHQQLVEAGFMKEILEILNEQEDVEEHFVWISSLKVNSGLEYNRVTLKQDSHFISDLLQQIDGYSDQDFEEALSPLFNNRKAAPLLANIKEGKQEIMESVERLLLQELLKTSR